MNKEDLIEALTNSAGLTKADSGRVVDSVIATITKSLSKGEEVRLAGFGAFVVTKRAASMGRASIIRKRTSHITVELDDISTKSGTIQKKAAPAAVAKEPAKHKKVREARHTKKSKAKE